MTTWRITEPDITQLALCKVGANKQRVFLLKSGDEEQSVSALAPLYKAEGSDWQTAYVPVAVPGAEENQGIFGTGSGDQDVWEGEAIRAAAHSFMQNGGKVVAKHFDSQAADGVTLSESAVALADFDVEKPGGGTHTIKEGTWYVGLNFDERVRHLVKDGEIDAVSVEGLATRVAKAQMVQAESYSDIAQHPDTVNLDAIPDRWSQELCDCMAWCEGRNWQAMGQSPEPEVAVMAKIDTYWQRALIAKDAILVPDKPGANNWIDRTGTGNLPSFIGDIAGDLITERGKTTGQAIQLAVGIVRNWCHGQGNVTAKTRAKACAAAGEWEAKKAASHVAKCLSCDGGGNLEPMEEKDRTLLQRMAKALGIPTEADREVSRQDPGTVGDVELNERVEKVEAAVESLTTKLIGTEEEPGAIAKLGDAVQKLTDKADEKPDPERKDDPEKPDLETREGIAKAIDQIAEKFAGEMEPLAERLDRIEAGESDQPETNGKKTTVAKGDSPMAGILFD